MALAGLLGAIALWIDKWVMWRGAAGVDHELGLMHAPIYDSAIFSAHLTIIPALALFVVYFETTFYANYRSYYAAIREHATLVPQPRPPEAGFFLPAIQRARRS